MTVRELSVPGAWEITPELHGDSRGLFFEWFTDAGFTGFAGHRFDMHQANCSVSAAGVLRGVHFAELPPSQAKYETSVRSRTRRNANTPSGRPIWESTGRPATNSSCPNVTRPPRPSTRFVRQACCRPGRPPARSSMSCAANWGSPLLHTSHTPLVDNGAGSDPAHCWGR